LADFRLVFDFVPHIGRATNAVLVAHIRIFNPTRS